MKVLHIDRQRQWAGQQVRTYNLSKLLLARGDEVIFACTPGSGYETHATKDGLRCFPVWMRGRKIAPAVVKVARLIRREKIDVIDAHGSLEHHLALFATKLIRRGVVVRTKHNHTDFHSAVSRFTYGRLTRRIIAVSRFVEAVLVRNGIKPEMIDTIPSSVDTAAIRAAAAQADRAAARERLGIPPGAFAVGTTSRYTPRKGLDVAARAVASILAKEPGRSILFCPAHRKSEKMENLAARSGLPPAAMHPLGFVEKLTDLFAGLDLFLLPSRDEALGMGLLEALAAGVPAIASAVGGVPEIVIHEKTGLLVPPGDDAALAAAIIRLQDDPALARRLAEAGREHMVAHHDVHPMTDATRRSYEKALAPKG